jgi:hypothetical protein
MGLFPRDPLSVWRKRRPQSVRRDSFLISWRTFDKSRFANITARVFLPLTKDGITRMILGIVFEMTFRRCKVAFQCIQHLLSWNASRSSDADLQGSRVPIMFARAYGQQFPTVRVNPRLTQKVSDGEDTICRQIISEPGAQSEARCPVHHNSGCSSPWMHKAVLDIASSARTNGYTKTFDE